jgi:ADP-ribose pyrophosphatase
VTRDRDPELDRDLTRDDVEVVEKATVYKGRFQVDRYRLRHKRHDGGWSEPFLREVFERGQAAAVLPYDPVLDRVVLIEQFRPGAYAAGRHPWLVEIVAGIIDPGETAEAVVRREAWEEAHVELGAVERIASFLMTPGACTEAVEFFVGRVDARGAGGVFGLAHEHEDIRVFTASTDEAAALLAAGKIENALAFIAIQWLLLNRMQLRDRWGAFKR